jgi:Gpi18-like mannosyltransferase
MAGAVTGISNAPAGALRETFTDYLPPYIYLLVLVVSLKKLLPDPVLAIKLISIAFDYAMAAVMFRLVRARYPAGYLPVLGYASVLLAPTVICNSGVWGQADAIYTIFLLACLHLCCTDRRVISPEPAHRAIP